MSYLDNEVPAFCPLLGRVTFGWPALWYIYIMESVVNFKVGGGPLILKRTGLFTILSFLCCGADSCTEGSVIVFSCNEALLPNTTWPLPIIVPQMPQEQQDAL